MWFRAYTVKGLELKASEWWQLLIEGLEDHLHQQDRSLIPKHYKAYSHP